MLFFGITHYFYQFSFLLFAKFNIFRIIFI